MIKFMQLPILFIMKLQNKQVMDHSNTVLTLVKEMQLKYDVLFKNTIVSGLEFHSHFFSILFPFPFFQKLLNFGQL